MLFTTFPVRLFSDIFHCGFLLVSLGPFSCFQQQLPLGEEDVLSVHNTIVMVSYISELYYLQQTNVYKHLFIKMDSHNKGLNEPLQAETLTIFALTCIIVINKIGKTAEGPR